MTVQHSSFIRAAYIMDALPQDEMRDSRAERRLVQVQSTGVGAVQQGDIGVHDGVLFVSVVDFLDFECDAHVRAAFAAEVVRAGLVRERVVALQREGVRWQQVQFGGEAAVGVDV